MRVEELIEGKAHEVIGSVDVDVAVTLTAPFSEEEPLEGGEGA